MHLSRSLYERFSIFEYLADEANKERDENKARRLARGQSLMTSFKPSLFFAPITRSRPWKWFRSAPAAIQSAIMFGMLGGTIATLYWQVKVAVPRARMERCENEVQALIRARGWAKDEPVASES